MKVSYFIALVVFALGIGLLALSASDGSEVSFLGLAFHSRIARGVGVISTIFGLITFLVAYGSSLPQSQNHHGQ